MAAYTTLVLFASFALTPRSLLSYICTGLLTILVYKPQPRRFSLPALPSADHSVSVGASPSLYSRDTEFGPSRRQTSLAIEVGHITGTAYKGPIVLCQLGDRVQDNLAHYRLTDAITLNEFLRSCWQQAALVASTCCAQSIFLWTRRSLIARPSDTTHHGVKRARC